MKANSLSYEEQLTRAIRKARKENDAEATLYYEQKLGTSSACGAWETFKGSWAGEQWLKANSLLIEATQKNLNSKIW